MEMQTIKVTTRSNTGKGPARRQRTAGDIPAVVYGEGFEALPVNVNAKVFDAVVHSGLGEHAVVQIDVEDKPEMSGPTMIKDVQHHPIREHIMHADFQRIKLDKPIQTQVPINLVGHCVGLIEGGVPDQQLRELEIECLPLETPEYLDVDITDLAIGGRLHVSDLTAPEGITFLTDDDRTIIAIHAPRVAGAAETGEEGAEEGAEEAAAEA